MQENYGIIKCEGQINGTAPVPEGARVINTTYNYVDVRWNTIPTSNFTNGTVKGYIVALQKVGGSEEDETLLVTSCHSDGINVTNLEENTKYCVQVAAFTEYGKGNSTPCMSAVTGERARVEFTAFNESSKSIRLKWDSDIPIPIDDSQEDGLKIDYRPADSTAERSRLFCGDESTYLFSNLTAFTNYCFNLVGFNKGEIITKINNSQCVYTDEEAPSGPPLDVTVRNESSTSINVTWRPINASLQHGIILGYRIHYEKDMNVSQRRKRRSLQSFDVTVLGQNNLTWVIEELEKFTKYCIEIVGFNRKGDGKQSNWVCTMTDEDVPSRPPMNLAGYNTSSTSIAIRWGEIPSTFVHGYLLGHQISYEQISGEMDGSQTAVTVDTSPYDRNKSLSGLQVYTKYCVRLAGRTRIGTGKKSECTNITTDEEIPTSPPLDVTAIDGTSTDTLNVSWKTPVELNGKLTGYKILVETTLENGTTLTNEIMTCDNRITLTDLDMNTEYKIRVAASTRKGLGPFSEVEYGETCNCPETLQVVAHPSSFDANGRPTLKKMMEELVVEACGECHTHENKKTRLISGLEDDCDLKFPIVQSGDSAQEATGTKFVAVLDVPGLVVLRRKVETELGFYEKVMASSVVNSWPICAIFGVMTLAAALQIWLLDMHSNPEEFPPTIVKGTGEGLWWAFITVTTLGYGDRTPKSDLSKIFAVVWFLIGMIVFGLFSSAITTSLTVVVVTGGPQGDANKHANISTIKGSQEEHIAVRKLSNKFNIGTSYANLSDLADALRTGKTGAILLDLFVHMKRKDLFNHTTTWYTVTEVINKKLTHGIELRGVSTKLAKELENFILDRNLERNFLDDKNEKDENEEENEASTETVQEEEELVFFEPKSPFFQGTLKYGGGALAGLVLCGVIYETFRWLRGKKIRHIGRTCQDEDEMRELVENFYQDFTQKYKQLRKKNKDVIKFCKKHAEGTHRSVQKESDNARWW